MLFLKLNRKWELYKFFTNLILSQVLERVTVISTAVMTTLVKEIWLFSINGVYLPHQFKTVELKSK